MKDIKPKSLLIGGVLASLVASACCVGPVVFAALGLTSAGLISQLEPLRGIFSVITIAFLVIAFYLTYRNKPAQECHSDSYCAETKSDAWKKSLLWSVTFVVIALLTFPYWSALNKRTDRDTSSLKNAIAKEYYIKGMTCGGCIVGVQNALKKASSLNIIDEDVSVGKMILTFHKSDYAALKTDCMVSTTIESATEYEVYKDTNYTSKACK